MKAEKGHQGCFLGWEVPPDKCSDHGYGPGKPLIQGGFGFLNHGYLIVKIGASLAAVSHKVVETPERLVQVSYGVAGESPGFATRLVVMQIWIGDQSAIQIA